LEFNFSIDKKAIDARVKNELLLAHSWRNRFHIEMPFGLINDPNGLSFYEDAYHIFYQWNPYGCEHKNKCWAHVKTRDFIHYTVPELALWPSDAFDKNGCYTGCAYVEGDKLHVVYTGNVKNEKNERRSYQRMGTLQADGTINKERVLIAQQPKGYTDHFRDPYVFTRDKEKYMLLGCQSLEKKGGVVLYHRVDGEWVFVSALKTALGDFGYMWECPNLLQFRRQDVLFFSPQGIEAEEYAYQNRYQSGYIVGGLNTKTAEFAHGDFTETDRGFDFYAPQVFTHEGRNILIGWIGMPENEAEYPTAEKGWIYSLTMPRTLTLRDDHIYAEPVKEVRDLRMKVMQEIDAENVETIHAILPREAEILLNIELGKAAKLTLDVLFSEEKVVFLYDAVKQVMTIDRRGMQLGGHGVRRFRLAAEEHMQLRIFLDHTVIELFCQYGEETATLMVFPKKGYMPELRLAADDILPHVTGTIWKLGGIVYKV
jgi:beta-fructofuranosidase